MGKDWALIQWRSGGSRPQRRLDYPDRSANSSWWIGSCMNSWRRCFPPAQFWQMLPSGSRWFWTRWKKPVTDRSAGPVTNYNVSNPSRPRRSCSRPSPNPLFTFRKNQNSVWKHQIFRKTDSWSMRKQEPHDKEQVYFSREIIRERASLRQLKNIGSFVSIMTIHFFQYFHSKKCKKVAIISCQNL